MKELNIRKFCVVDENLKKIRKAYDLLNGILTVINTHNPHTSSEIQHIKYYVITNDEKEKLGRLNLSTTELDNFTDTLIKEGRRFKITEIVKNVNYLQQVKNRGVHTGDLEGMIEDYGYVRTMLKRVFENRYRFKKCELVAMNGINKTTRILEERYETQSVYGDSEF